MRKINNFEKVNVKINEEGKVFIGGYWLSPKAIKHMSIFLYLTSSILIFISLFLMPLGLFFILIGVVLISIGRSYEKISIVAQKKIDLGFTEEEEINFVKETYKEQYADKHTKNNFIEPKPDISENQKINVFTKKWCNKCNNFVVIDFETTGLNETFDEIIEVSAIKYENNLCVDSYVTFVKPTKPISSQITKINGITNSMVKDAPDISDVIPKLMYFIGDNIIVAHNANFDMKFLKANALRLGISVTNNYICTLTISRKMYPELNNHKLSTVAKHLKIFGDGWHRAEFDSKAAAEILITSLNTYNQ